MKRFVLCGLAGAAMVVFAGLAQAQTVFNVDLDGAQAGTASTFTGSGTVTLNGAENQITVAVTHNVPNGNVTAGHIHQGAPAVSGPVIFPFANGQSPINEVFAITAPQVAILKAEGYYVNIHTVAFGGGEIRGQIVNPPLPTPINPFVLVSVVGVLLVVGATLAMRRISPRA